MPDTLILGAGLAGLATAYHLKSDWEILEREDHPGGLCVTHQRDGYSFDVTGHWLHLRDPKVKRLVHKLMPDGFMEVTRLSEIFSKGVYTPYPFQTNTHGLPTEVVAEILTSFVSETLVNPPEKEPETFEEWVLKYMGSGIAKHFMVPYNSKLWRTHPRDMTPLWCQIYIPKPTLEQIIKGALAPPEGTIGYNAGFIYPQKGGINALPKALAKALKQDRIRYKTEPVEISAKKKTAKLSDGSVTNYRHLVSSAPLPELVKLIVDAPKSVRQAAEKLVCNQVCYYNIALKDKPLRKSHWAYLPEPNVVFYRAGSFSNAAPYMAPKGKGNLYVEVSHRGDLNYRGQYAKLVKNLVECGMIKSRDSIEHYERRNIEYAYVVFDKNYLKSTETIHGWLKKNGIYSIGRYGRWTYNSMETAIIDGYQTADAIRAAGKNS